MALHWPHRVKDLSEDTKGETIKLLKIIGRPLLIQTPLMQTFTNPNTHFKDIHGNFEVL